MTLLPRLLLSSLPLAMLIPLCGFSPESSQRTLPFDFIVTAAPTYTPLAELQGKERFPKGAQLMVVHAGKVEPLMTGFVATADANISFDGSRVLFAGKKNSGDPWQIYEFTFSDHSTRKVITTSGDAERPLYLPGGRMVWAQRTATGFELQSSEDGDAPGYLTWSPTADPGLLQLTHLRGNAFPADVLRDGRILFEANYPLGDGATPDLYLVYADGSGVESVRCDHGRARWGGVQLASGDIVFTQGASLGRFRSELAHEEPVPGVKAVFAGSIAETATGEWLVSARAAGAAHYSIEMRQPSAAAAQNVASVSGYDLVEPVVIAPRDRPNRHPSGLHPWNYANLLALDSRVSRESSLKTTPSRVRMEAMDAEGHATAMGTTPVEKDGSFFVQVPGDRPIRFSLLDRNGAVVRQERGWFWARSGEQRICTGCHAGPERAAENRVPEVLLRTTTPVDLTGQKPLPAQAAAAGGSQ